jgi:predicted NUDIX family NTP pyrophosphohydrolase
MAAKRSAGILLFRTQNGQPEVLIAHMGGPLWSRRDAGAWSIPKGEYLDDEAPQAAARREFQEELGLPVPDGDLIELGSVKQSSGKIVTVWALRGDLDPAQVVPGTFRMEWPKGSGVQREYPEIDRVGWFALPTAGEKLVTAQREFLNRLAERLGR